MNESYSINGSWLSYKEKGCSKAINMNHVVKFELGDNEKYISFTFGNNPTAYVYFDRREEAQLCFVRLQK